MDICTFMKGNYVLTALCIAQSYCLRYKICIVKSDYSIVELHVKGLKLESVLVKLVQLTLIKTKVI